MRQVLAADGRGAAAARRKGRARAATQRAAAAGRGRQAAHTQLRRGFFLQLSLLLLASAARLLELTEEDEVGPGYADTGTAVARETGALSGDDGKQQLQEQEQQQEEKQQLQQQNQPHHPRRQQPHQLNQPHQLRQAGRKRAPDAGPANAGPADSGTPFSRGTPVPLGAGRHLKAVEKPSGQAHVGTAPSRDQAPGISSLDASACGDEAAPRREATAKLGSGSGKPSAGAPPGGASGAGPRRQSSGSAAGEGGGASRSEPPMLGAGKLSPDASRQDAPGKAGKTPKSSSKKHKKSAIDDIFCGL